MLHQDALDLAEFDTVASKLDLMVEPAEELDGTILPTAAYVAGAVEARTRSIRERIWYETLRR
jgi:hypothetical protein